MSIQGVFIMNKYFKKFLCLASIGYVSLLTNCRTTDDASNIQSSKKGKCASSNGKCGDDTATQEKRLKLGQDCGSTTIGLRCEKGLICVGVKGNLPGKCSEKSGAQKSDTDFTCELKDPFDDWVVTVKKDSADFFDNDSNCEMKKTRPAGAGMTSFESVEKCNQEQALFLFNNKDLTGILKLVNSEDNKTSSYEFVCKKAK